MQLTDEQKLILDEVKKGTKVIKINAFAGTGKTTTLVEIAKANKDKRILYLAFNKAIQQEALKKFPKNVDVKTTHALAYRYIILKNFQKPEVRGNYRVSEIKELLNTKDFQNASIIANYFEYYCNSSIPRIEDLGLASDIKEKIIEFWDLMEKKEIPVTHSFYLKMFERMLLKKDIKINYDIVLLDEAQDTNDVTLSIFKAIKAKQKILVGDRHQQIYSFRGSINAMDKIKGKELYLTNSFRFNQDIADKANKILNLFKGETHTLKGLGKNQKVITKAVITRTNSKLIETIDTLIKKEINFKTIRKPYEIFGLALNILALLKEDKLDNNYMFLKSLTQGVNNILYTLEQIAISTDDMELYGAVKIINMFKERLYDLYETAQKKYYENDIDIENTLFLTTAHTSKGLEFDGVRIEDDFSLINTLAKWYIEKLKNETDEKSFKKNLFIKKDYIDEFLKAQKKDTSSSFQKTVDEFNLYYVAVTRTKTLLKDFTELNKNLNKDTINDMIYKQIIAKYKKDIDDF